MDIVINIVGFIVAFLVVIMGSLHILIMLFQQVPFMRKMREWNVLRFTRKTYAMYALRTVVWAGTIIGAFFIPITGVSLGALFGLLLGLRSGLGRAHRESVSIEVIKDAERNSEIIDHDSLDILKLAISSGTYARQELVEILKREKYLKFFKE